MSQSMRWQRVGNDLAAEQQLYICVYIYICITKSLCYTAQIGTTLEVCRLQSTVGYSQWGCKESDMIEKFHFHFCK